MEPIKTDLVKALQESLAVALMGEHPIYTEEPFSTECYICRVPIEEQCEQCVLEFAFGLRTEIDCPEVVLDINHVVHLHCMDNWVEEHQAWFDALCNT